MDPLRLRFLPFLIAGMALAGCMRTDDASGPGAVEVGMTKAEVRRVAGPPDEVSGGQPACWNYGWNGDNQPADYTICFDGATGKVASIDEDSALG